MKVSFGVSCISAIWYKRPGGRILPTNHSGSQLPRWTILLQKRCFLLTLTIPLTSAVNGEAGRSEERLAVPREVPRRGAVMMCAGGRGRGRRGRGSPHSAELEADGGCPRRGGVHELSCGARLRVQSWPLSNRQSASRVWSQTTPFWPRQRRNLDLGRRHRLRNHLSLVLPRLLSNCSSDGGQWAPSFKPRSDSCNLVHLYLCELFPLLAMSFDQD